MGKLVDLLVKANLVRYSDDEQAEDEQPPPSTIAEPQSADPGFSSSNTAPCEAQAALCEGTPFESIYQAAQLPAVPYTAEKLLRLLGGLRAMDAATRKAAVTAMDEADDSWDIAGVIADAKAKMTALSQHKQALAAQVQRNEATAREASQSVQDALAQTTTEVRKQMADLEALLQRESAKAAQQTAALEANQRSAREALLHEVGRIDGEIDRLNEVPATFSPTTTQ